MKILVFGDLHSTSDAGYSTILPDGGTTHLENVANTFGWLADLVTEHRPDMVVNLGDLIDTPSMISTVNLHYVHDGLLNLQEACISAGAEIHHILGNHDIATEAHHTLSWVSGHVVDQLTIVDMGKYRVVMLPWGCDPSKESLPDDYDLAFGHLPLQGAEYNFGTSSKEGYNLRDLIYAPYFGGHYHKAQTLDSSSFLVGSVLHRTFKDSLHLNKFNKLNRASAVLVDYKEPGDLNTTRIHNPHSMTFLTTDINSETSMCELPDINNLALQATYPLELEDKVKKWADKAKYSVLKPKLKQLVARETNISLFAKPESNLAEYLKITDTQLPKGDLETMIQDGMKDFKPDFSSMKELQFDKLTMENFLSVGKADFRFPKSGLVYLGGLNGEGKSSIAIEALWWVLTGKILTKEITGDDVIREGEKGGTCVELLFKLNGKPITLSRGRKHKTLKNGIQVIIDGESFKDRKSSDRQKRLDDLLGPGFKDYLTQAVLLREGLKNSFSKLGYADRARLLETYIDTKPYEHFQEYVANKRSNLEAKKAKVLQESMVQDRMLADIRQKIAIQVDILNNASQVQFKAKEDAEAAIRSLEVEAKQVKSDLASRLNLKESTEMAVATLKQEVETAKQEFEEANKKYWEADAQWKQAKKDLAKIEDFALKGLCDKCGSKFDISDEEFTQSKVFLQHASQAMEQGMSESSAKKTCLTKLEDKLQSYTSILISVPTQISTLIVRVNDIRTKMQTAKSNQNVVEDKTNEIKMALESSEEAEKGIQGQLASLRASEDKLMAQEALYAFWDTHMGVKQFRSFLLDQLVQYINSILDNMSQYVYNNAKVQLSSTRELKTGSSKNEVMIETIGTRAFGKMSSGERRVVDILIQLATASLSERTQQYSCNYLAMDEIFDSVDKENIEACMELLNHLSKDKWILVTSHNPMVSSSIDKAWTATKQTGATSLMIS